MIHQFVSRQTFKRSHGPAETFNVMVTLDEDQLARLLGGRCFNLHREQNTVFNGAASVELAKVTDHGQ